MLNPGIIAYGELLVKKSSIDQSIMMQFFEQYPYLFLPS